MTPARSPIPSPSPSAKLRGQIWYTTALFHHGSPPSTVKRSPAPSSAIVPLSLVRRVILGRDDEPREARRPSRGPTSRAAGPPRRLPPGARDRRGGSRTSPRPGAREVVGGRRRVQRTFGDLVQQL